jgi:hypothetical protein
MKGTYVLGIALIAVIAGFALGYFMPHPASVTPTLSLSATSVAAGTQYSVKLSGFPANTDIYGWAVNENPPRAFEVGTTNAQGELTVTGEAPQTSGKWPLVACDENYQYWATAMLTVP